MCGSCVRRKTLKPAKVGGVAGGAKYIVQGILYKFCLDPLVSKKVGSLLKTFSHSADACH
jgi:hypothetical protein